MRDLGEFVLFGIQPFRRDPEAFDGWTFASAIGDFFLSGSSAFVIWKLVDAEQTDLVARFVEVSAAWLVAGLVWAGYRLMRVLNRYEHPELRVLDAGHHDQWTLRDNKPMRATRIALVQVETTGGDVERVRLNLLRFWPQGRNGAILLRERHDVSDGYAQSAIQGFPVQLGAPVVFDLCSFQDPALQPKPDGKTFMAIHYAARAGLEPNAIEASRRYYFEVQAVGSRARSEPTTFYAEIDGNGELQTGMAEWPVEAGSP